MRCLLKRSARGCRVVSILGCAGKSHLDAGLADKCELFAELVGDRFHLSFDFALCVDFGYPR